MQVRGRSRAAAAAASGPSGRPSAARRRRRGRSRRSSPAPGCRPAKRTKTCGGLAGSRARRRSSRRGRSWRSRRRRRCTKPEPRPAAPPLPGVVQAGRDDRHDAGRLARGRSPRGSKPPAARRRRCSSDLHARRRAATVWCRVVVVLAAAAGERSRAERPAAAARPTGARVTRGAPGRRSCGRGTLSAVSSPSMRSASSCAMARPRPEPLGVVGGVEGLEDRGQVAALDARSRSRSPRGARARRGAPRRRRRRCPAACG